MKPFRSTWVMAVLVAVLAAYTFWEFRKAEREGSLAEGEKPAFSMKANEVSEVTFTRGDETIHLKKDKDQWHMDKPVEDLGENASIDGFLFQLLGQRVRPINAEDEQVNKDWAKFGLDKPAAVIEVRGKNGAEAIAISSKNAFDGSFYLRQKDELLLGDRGLAPVKERQAASFRSRSLWREDTKIEKVKVDGASGSFTIVKDGDKWRLEPKPAFETDSKKLHDWIERVIDFTPADIVKDSDSPEDAKEYLLAKPSLTVAINDNLWKLEIGQDRGGEVFLRTNKRPTIYKTTPGVLNQIRVPVTYFRDGHKPFQFPVEQARKVEIHTAKMNHAFKRTDSGWALEGGGKDLELDQDKLVQLIQSIAALEAREFVKGPGTGIKAPQVIVRDEKGAELLSLAWGDEFKAKEAYNSGIPLRYTRTNHENDVMGLPKDKLDGLIEDKLVKKKTADAPKAAASNPEPK